MCLVHWGCIISSPALVEQGPGSTDHEVLPVQEVQEEQGNTLEQGISQRVAVECAAGGLKTLVLMVLMTSKGMHALKKLVFSW